MNRRRKQNHRAKPQIKGWTIALRQYILPALLVVGVGLYSAKDSFYFDNGAGGADWKIGKPKVTWLNAQSQRPLPETRQFALSLVNRDRQVNGLAPLVEDPLLSQAAQTHAEDMLKRHYFAHKTPEGRMPSDRFAQVGGKGGAGENIAKQTGKIGASSTYGLVEQF